MGDFDFIDIYDPTRTVGRACWLSAAGARADAADPLAYLSIRVGAAVVSAALARQDLEALAAEMAQVWP